MNLIFYLAAALAFALATGGAYWKGRNDGIDIAEAEDARLERVALEARAASARAAADAIAKINVQHQTIYQQVERTVRENIVYRECVHPADQLQRINAAITGRPAERAGDRKLPRLDAVER